MTIETDVSSAWLIADASRMMRKLVDRKLEPVGMTRAQLKALISLRNQGSMTQSALADAVEIETATVARLIDRLEAAGWVQRKVAPGDRRVKLVTMTGKAEYAIEDAMVVMRRLHDEIISDLTPLECDELNRTLITIKSRLLRLLETP